MRHKCIVRNHGKGDFIALVVQKAANINFTCSLDFLRVINKFGSNQKSTSFNISNDGNSLSGSRIRGSLSDLKNTGKVSM